MVETVTPPSTTICSGTTKSGAACKRKAVAGSMFCTQHGKTAAASAPKKKPVHRDVPQDIDLGALDTVVKDLRKEGSSFAGAPVDLTNHNPIDELQHVAEFVSDNLGRLKDMAVSSGLVEAGKFEAMAGDVLSALLSAITAMNERVSGEYEEDDFGFDQRFTEGMFPLFSLLYQYYWRVDVEGIENVPATGRGLLVSNHAGAGLPFDGAMVKSAIWKEHSTPRHARILVLDWAMAMPWMSDFMKKTGQVLACTPNALELLKRDELVGVFPEGVKGMSKPFSQRYNLERFGRGGFVRVALRTGSPIIPVAVIGSEEIYPKIGNLPFVNKLIGAPFVPVTPLFPLFGIMGFIPLPAKWHIEFCEPIDVSEYPAEAADDRSLVLELSEQIRSTIQQRLRENLLLRRTPFW